MTLKLNFKKYNRLTRLLAAASVITFILVLGLSYVETTKLKTSISDLNTKDSKLKKQLDITTSKLTTREKELEDLKHEDQYVKNKKLEEEINNIVKTYKQAVASYENLLSLKEQTSKTGKYDDLFTKSLTLLSQRNYASADAVLTSLNSQIRQEKDKIAAQFTIPANVPQNNAPPSSGYSRQQVQTDVGNFLVDIVSADLGSTRVIVDTASDSECHDNCPVLSLSDYVSRNGAYAGLNGSYFCPASYPSCAGKTNSFDTLLMNKNKVYFNSDNNVYSTVPAVIFGGGWIRFVGQSLEWGRDTGIDSMVANQPLLVSGGNVVFGGDDDPKKGSRGSRSFVANKGNSVYIGVVYSATVAEAARVSKALGFENSLNLDDGGSTALWTGGYKAGPGRNIPNAILFVRK